MVILRLAGNIKGDFSFVYHSDQSQSIDEDMLERRDAGDVVLEWALSSVMSKSSRSHLR